MDWKQICSSFIEATGSAKRASQIVGCEAHTFARLASGHTAEPKYALGVRILEAVRRHKNPLPPRTVNPVGQNEVGP